MSLPWGPQFSWTPEGFEAAFPIALLSLVCWGTWGNTVKAAKAAGVPDAVSSGVQETHAVYADVKLHMYRRVCLIWCRKCRRLFYIYKLNISDDDN